MISGDGSTLGDADDFVTAFSTANFTNLEASVITSGDFKGAISIKHKLGGEFRMVDTLGTPLADAGFSTTTAHSYGSFTANSTTLIDNLYDAPTGESLDSSANNAVVATNFKRLSYTASTDAPTSEPADGTLWYDTSIDEADIMAHNGTTFVGYRTAYSTTDPKETMELNGEVIVLDEGKVLQVGPAKEIFENPNSLKVAEISNDPPMNIIEAKISDNNIKFEGINLEAPQHLSKLTEDGLKIGLRSSDIELNKNGHEFEVELAEISGSETLLHLKRGDTKIIVSIEEVLNFKIHDKVKINFKIDRAYAFNADGKLASSPFGGLSGQN